MEAWKWHPHKVYIHDQGQAGGHPVESGCFLPRLCFHTCDHRERLGYTGMRSTKLRAFLSSGAARPSTGQGTAKVSADPVGYPGTTRPCPTAAGDGLSTAHTASCPPQGGIAYAAQHRGAWWKEESLDPVAIQSFQGLSREMYVAWRLCWVPLAATHLSEFQPTGQSFRIPTVAPVSMRTIWHDAPVGAPLLYSAATCR